MISPDLTIPSDTVIEHGVKIGNRVVLVGAGIVLRKEAQLAAACIIGEHVTIGRGAYVRTGAVVLQSVPPFAIVEGNPAKVVGYCSVGTSDVDRLDATHHVDLKNVANIARPHVLSLNVGGSSVQLMRRVTDTRGSLTVGEVSSELPFVPARYFIVFDVPSQELRGEHAHRKCEQFLICPHGSVRVMLDDGTNRCELTLDRPDIGVYMPAMIWGTQYRYSPGSSLLVFASRKYEAVDYLRSYDEFITEVEGRNR